MASATPYNPDDFENNNPFAETSNQFLQPEAQAQKPGLLPIVPDQAYHNENYNENQDDSQVAEYSAENAAVSPEEQASAEGQLTEEELRKVLPERFTNKYLISIKLVSIEKNKVGNPILKFDAAVKGLPKYRQAKYKDIRRTFSEVVRFNKYLTISNLEVFVPVIPLAETSYPTGGEDETKQLMYVWQEWFNRIVHNPILVRDEEFVFFIENNDFAYSVINSKRKSSVASGLVRKTLKQLALPYDPYEELSDFRPVIKVAYLTCQKLHKLLDRNSKAEKLLSLHIGELSQKLTDMSQFEITHPGMKNMWEKLSKIMLIQSDLVLIQLVNDMGTLGDGVRVFVDDFYEIKEALTNRHLIMRELLQAEAQTKTKHLQAAKIKSKSSLDPIKVNDAFRSLEYATKAQESLSLQVKRISGEMLYERKEFIEFTEKKFQKMLKKFALTKVDHHRKMLKHLETIRLDIRIIDQKGGLSRLNRDNLTSLKYNLAQSQSADGDAWTSRTFRSLQKPEEEQPAEEEADVSKDDGDAGAVDAKNAAHLLGVATF